MGNIDEKEENKGLQDDIRCNVNNNVSKVITASRGWSKLLHFWQCELWQLIDSTRAVNTSGFLHYKTDHSRKAHTLLSQTCYRHHMFIEWVCLLSTDWLFKCMSIIAHFTCESLGNNTLLLTLSLCFEVILIAVLSSMLLSLSYMCVSSRIFHLFDLSIVPFLRAAFCCSSMRLVTFNYVLPVF